MISGRCTTILAGLWLVLCAWAAPAAAGGLNVGEKVSVCFSRAALTPRAAFAGNARFDCTTPQKAMPAGDYWALSAPLAARTGRVPVAVRFASLWQRDATLYALYRDGDVAVLRLDGRTLTRRMRVGAIVEQPLPLRGVPVVRLLWHIEGASNLRGILGDPRVVTHAESARSDLILGMVYAGFAGLCIALLVYNLALWAALRHGFQLAYCVMVASLLVYAFSASGLLSWVLPDIANNDRMRVNYLSLALAATTALLFARAFFEQRIFAGWLGRCTAAVVVAVLGSAMLIVLVAPWQMEVLDRLYVWSYVGVLAIMPAILWRAWRGRSNYLWAFAIAWAAPILLAGARVGNSLHLIDRSFWLDNSTLIAMAIEALISSMAIAYRMRLIAAQLDIARTQEIAARLLADTDPLTGLLNRRAFMAQAIGRADEQLLMLADIDHFKRVNETIGHDGGDEVLRVVARALEAAVPHGTLVSRMGGEEFAILAPATLGLDPADVLDRVRGAGMPYDLQVTISIGTCTGILTREVDWKAMYRHADRALFAAKSAGRDRVRRAPSLAFAA